MSIRVSSTLDHGQRICRKMSFYDLVELMTFGKLVFATPPRPLLATSCSMRASLMPAPDVDRSWKLLDDETAIDWDDDVSMPAVYVISTVRALAESLLICEDMEVSIDRTVALSLSSMRYESVRTTHRSVRDDGTLTVALRSTTGRVTTECQHSPRRLPVDLRMLLASVLISPKASARFVDLVSDVVQRVTRATVSRARSCSSCSPSLFGVTSGHSQSVPYARWS